MRARNCSKYETIIYSLLLLFTILLQSTIGDYLSIFGVKPNLLLIFIISYAVREGGYPAAKVGLAAGLVTDVLVGRYIGFYGLIFMYCAISAGAATGSFHKENYLPVIFTTFLLSILFESIIYILIRIGSNMDYFYILRKYILIEALYNTVLSVFYYFILGVVNSRFSGQQITVKF